MKRSQSNEIQKSSNQHLALEASITVVISADFMTICFPRLRTFPLGIRTGCIVTTEKTKSLLLIWMFYTYKGSQLWKSVCFQNVILIFCGSTQYCINWVSYGIPPGFLYILFIKIKKYIFKCFCIQKKNVCLRRQRDGKQLWNDNECLERDLIFFLFIAPDSKEKSNFLVAIHCFMSFTLHLHIVGIWEQLNIKHSHNMFIALGELLSDTQGGKGKKSNLGNMQGLWLYWQNAQNWQVTECVWHLEWILCFKIWPSISTLQSVNTRICVRHQLNTHQISDTSI